MSGHQTPPTPQSPDLDQRGRGGASKGKSWVAKPVPGYPCNLQPLSMAPPEQGWDQGLAKLSSPCVVDQSLPLSLRSGMRAKCHKYKAPNTREIL